VFNRDRAKRYRLPAGRTAAVSILSRRSTGGSAAGGGCIMQLTVREVGTFLNTPEATVTRWIKQRGLPAHQVGGQYRFNRAELLEWATAQKIKVSQELFDQVAGDTEPIPQLSEALTAGGIHYRLPGADKDEVLRALIAVLPVPADTDREMLLQLFRAREAAASTGIGDGIALPHVRNPIVLAVTRPSITLCFLERLVEFGALDGQPVGVLFSLVSPTTRCHLQMLARLSFALHDAQFKDVVRQHGTAEEILRHARRIEAAAAARAAEQGKAAR
jgi:PTS system nitrogen regulatory IIA component